MTACSKWRCLTLWVRVRRGDQKTSKRPVTIALAGTGSRGRTFSSFAERYPERARVVAVADPRTARREALADRLGVAADRRFDDWRELAALPPFADAVIITTPDYEHVGPACRFAELGYHVLLRSEEHTSELQSPYDLVCRLL